MFNCCVSKAKNPLIVEREEKSCCRVTAKVTLIAFGIILVVGGILALLKVSYFSYVRKEYAYALIASGSLLFIAGLILKKTTTITLFPAVNESECEALKSGNKTKLEQQAPSFHGKDIQIKPETLATMQRNFWHIRSANQQKLADSVTCYESGDNYSVFTVKEERGVIFKLDRNGFNANEPPKRYYNSLKVKELCEKNNFDRLIVPQSRVFNLGAGFANVEYPVIIEKMYDCNEEENYAGEHFDIYKEQLQESLRQLTALTCIVGLADNEWRNLKVLLPKEGVSKETKLSLVLVDLELIGGEWGCSNPTMAGLFGHVYLKRRGLVGCLFHDEQFELVKQEAQKHIQWDEAYEKAFKDAVAKRKAEIAEERAILQTYQTKGIKGSDPITLTGSDLGFSDKEGQEADIVLSEINLALANKKPQKSLMQRRKIYFDLETSEKGKKIAAALIKKVVSALQAKGIVFKILYEYNTSFRLQV